MRSIPRRRSSVDTMRRSFWPSIMKSQRQIRYNEWDYDALVYSLLPFPRSLSKQDISRIATAQTILLAIAMKLGSSGNRCREKSFIPFHSNPSCSLKNSRKAGSSTKEARSLGLWSWSWSSYSPIEIIDLRLSAAERPDRCERQICARSPSSCRRPFLILTPSEEER